MTVKLTGDKLKLYLIKRKFMRIIHKINVVLAAAMVLSFSGVPALALNTHAIAQASAAKGQSEFVATPAQKLSDAKLKACQNRQKAITNIMTRMADRGQKQLDLFSTIATRTETFYTTKGKTLSNYDALVADVTAKKAAAQTEVDALKANSVSFKCDGTDPKGMADSFKTQLKAEILALKEYRTSVKNLIVGVKSVQGSTASADNKTTSTTNSTTGGN